jgi:hypothetical protein
MDNYQFYLPTRVRNFKSAEPDFSSLFHFLGALVSPIDGDPCTTLGVYHQLRKGFQVQT